MTSKEKAEELVNKIHYDIDYDLQGAPITKRMVAKQCALIAVDEIIGLLPNINLTPPIQRKSDEFYFQYWNVVKKEIEKL